MTSDPTQGPLRRDPAEVGDNTLSNMNNNDQDRTFIQSLNKVGINLPETKQAKLLSIAKKCAASSALTEIQQTKAKTGKIASAGSTIVGAGGLYAVGVSPVIAGGIAIAGGMVIAGWVAKTLYEFSKGTISCMTEDRKKAFEQAIERYFEPQVGSEE